jgi:hypothetical protein
VSIRIGSAAATYWVGEAMGKVDFKDLPQVPDKIAATARAAASNAAHSLPC